VVVAAVALVLGSTPPAQASGGSQGSGPDGAPAPAAGPTTTTTTGPPPSTAPPAGGAGGPTTTAAWSGNTPTTASTTTASTAPPTTLDLTNKSTPLLTNAPSELPQGEATLLGLLDTVHARMAGLQMQLQAMNKELEANQKALDDAARMLAMRQLAVGLADQRVMTIAEQMAAAKEEMRARAVAAYIRQPTGELANLLVHMRDPADLTDARVYYRALVDAQAVTVARYDRLQRAAIDARSAAAQARDEAKRQQQLVQDRQVRLESLKTAFEQLQRVSADEAAQETDLLHQVNLRRDEFQAALAAQQQKSAEITAMLLAVEKSEGTALPPSNGFFARPLKDAPVTSPFGPRVDPIYGGIGFHPGVDFGASMGTPIGAAGDGDVIWAGENGGYGNCTIVDHGHNMATLYAHQSVILVHVGDQVKRNQVIGLVGSTGASTGPHLHFEVRISGTPVNPLPYL
jgi:murein DD-endopeptidase MepM/ murein hydrolase activator NlpD